MSHALADGFLTTEPPGKPLISKLCLNVPCTGLLREDEASSGHLQAHPALHVTPSPQALEHCGDIDSLVCSSAVRPPVGSTLGASEQVGDKVRGCPWELAEGSEVLPYQDPPLPS